MGRPHRALENADPERAAPDRRSQRQGRPFYRPLDFVVVRAPLLPIEVYATLGAAAQQRDHSFDPRVQRALAVGSTSLLDALEREQGSGDVGSSSGKLLRYLIRMSTRPTPFGLFAGVGLARWGEETDLALGAAPPPTRTRPDMDWLLDLVLSLEARPEVVRHLRLVSSSAAILWADRLWMATRADGKEGAVESVSVRATGAVRRALAAARRPVPYAVLSARILDETSGATPEKVEKLLGQLVEQSLLITDLRPPLTCEDPARYVADRLAGIVGAEEARSRLLGLLDGAAAFDAAPIEEGPAVYRSLTARARPAGSASARRAAVQVDMALSLSGDRIASAVGLEVARAAEVLLRLSPIPRGPSLLASHRRAFEARYGPDREVALLTLLDPHLGLGPLGASHGAQADEDPARQARRRQALLRLACAAQRDRHAVVELSAALLAELETWSPGSSRMPASLDLYAWVGARSAAALDRGEFQVVVGPNLGARAAGRNLARFAHLLGAGAREALERAARAEEEGDPDRIWAELVYLPRGLRLANVAIRPAVRSHEIVFGVSPGVPPERTLPLDELMVGVRPGRGFYLRWKDRDVVVCAGHMLNALRAPPACQFLSEIAQEGVAQPCRFDWGPAASFPFLPRVAAGRVVLEPATWRIDAAAAERELSPGTPASFRRALDAWRAAWEVPRHVYLSQGDNRLLLDLTDPHQAEELRVELRGAVPRGSVVLEEVLPALDDAWIEGPGGHFVSELVVPLVRQDPPPAASAVVLGRDPPPRPLPVVTAEERTRPPGSEWLFAKLYCPPSLEDDVITKRVRGFCEAAEDAGWADAWFFVRYADPERHLRLRIHGPPERLAGALSGACTWAGALIAEGLCLRFCLDTYDREVERYGGTLGMAAAEALFAADSRAVAAVLDLVGRGALSTDKTMIAVLMIDDLLAAAGLSEEGRLRWCRAHVANRRESSARYRRHQGPLRALVSDGRPSAEAAGAEDLASVLSARRAALAPVGLRLAALDREGRLSRSIEALCESYVHMCCNRLLGTERAEERMAIGLLLRAREGLAATAASRRSGPA